MLCDFDNRNLGRFLEVLALLDFDSQKFNVLEALILVKFRQWKFKKVIIVLDFGEFLEAFVQRKFVFKSRFQQLVKSPRFLKFYLYASHKFYLFLVVT